MIKGSTIIMSEAYIEELTRHKNNFQAILANTDIPDQQDILKERIRIFNQKIEEAMDFQDTVEEILNLDIPKMTVVKTVNGLVLPIANVKVL